eukprot:CAMPEP_0170734190 /NCGR_PEP_ID=MMETSP0437-20130122/2464_1 /TAXON_ID=0 /ORGANISM="Sexangularia sp." /LENGTH=816 /DNA_ID=CAMNT_0011072499 /DNA_START=36 /DNA_END=2486 /DNA_ORIENTATION=+
MEESGASDRADVLLSSFKSDTRSMIKLMRKFTEAGKAYSAAGSELGAALQRAGTESDWATGGREGLGPRVAAFGNTITSLAYTHEEAMRTCSSESTDRIARFLEYEFQKLSESRRRYDTLSTKARTAMEKKLDDPAALRSLVNESVEAGRSLNDSLEEMESKLETRFISMLVESLLALQKANVAGAKLMKNLDLSGLAGSLEHRAMELGVAADHEGVLKRKVGSFWKAVFVAVVDGHIEWISHDGTERKLTSGMRSKGGSEEMSGSVDLRLATVKEVLSDETATMFEVWNPGHKDPILFRADSAEGRVKWLSAIRDIISNQLSLTTIEKGGASTGSSVPAGSRGTAGDGGDGDSGSGAGMADSQHRAAGDGSAGVGGVGAGGVSASDAGDRGGVSSAGSHLGAYDNAKIARLTSALYAVDGNKCCADCSSRDPVWVSINLGILVCIDCSGVHRQLGTHITKVRSLELDRWDVELILFMCHAGNAMVNGLFEAGVVFSHLQIPKPKARSSREDKARFIEAKYKDRSFIQKTKLDQTNLDAKLAAAIEANSAASRLSEMLLLVAWGANVNAPLAAHRGQTVLHRAASLGSLVSVELLMQNGGDVTFTDDDGNTPMHAAVAYDNYMVLQQMLARAGKAAKLDVTNAAGETVLQLATARQCSECVRVLNGELIPMPLLVADEQLGDERSESLLYVMQVAVRERLRYLEAEVVPRLRALAGSGADGAASVVPMLHSMAPEFDRATTWLGDSRPTGTGLDAAAGVDEVTAALDDVDALIGSLNGAAADAANVLQMQAIFECVHSLVVLTGEPPKSPAAFEEE